MTGCSARNCSNRTEIGFRMFRFPADPERRKIWIERSGFDKPTASSRLCESHFDDCSFEKNRNDGVRKLTPNAIPTQFTKESTADASVNNQSSISKDTQHQNNTEDGIHDANDFTMNVLSNDSIVDGVNTLYETFHSSRKKTITAGAEKMAVDSPATDDSGSEDLADKNTITHEEAKILCEQLLNYFEKHDNIMPSDLVTLHRLRDLAALLKRRNK